MAENSSSHSPILKSLDFKIFNLDFQLWLAILSAVTVVFCFYVAVVTRGITFINVALGEPSKRSMTDCEIHVNAASHAHQWRWPSDIHKFTFGKSKARMKDVGVLGTALFQRLIGDKETIYPLIVCCNVAAGICALLIFLVASSYWNVSIGIISYCLFFFCYWPHQITLTGGFQCISLAILLASVLALQQISQGLLGNFGWITLSGFLIGLMMFSSASGRKFLPLFVGALLWSQRDFLDGSFFTATQGYLLLGLGGFLVISWTTLHFIYEPLVGKIIKSEKFLAKKKSVMKLIAKGLIAIFLFVAACIWLSKSNLFYADVAFVLLGFILGVLVFTLPNIYLNIKGYFDYWYTPRKANHFLANKEFFKRIGKPIKDTMRGDGLKWLLLFFMDILPFHVVLYLVAFGVALSSKGLLEVSGVLVLSLSPILYGEFTQSPQFARPYFPSLAGFLLMIAYGLAAASPQLLYIAGVIVIVSAAWNIWLYVSDILPSRMTPLKLHQALQRLSVQKIYTYQTSYNDALVHAFNPSVKKNYTIEYISNLKNVEEGFVVIPATTSKSLNIESYKEGIHCIDFDADPDLNRLLNVPSIQDCAVASFKTFGTSRIWVHDSEMPSYRKLILKDFKEEDRERGKAWILDAKKIKSILSTGTGS